MKVFYMIQEAKGIIVSNLLFQNLLFQHIQGNDLYVIMYLVSLLKIPKRIIFQKSNLFEYLGKKTTSSGDSYK